MKRRGFLAGLLAALVTRKVPLPEAPPRADDHALHVEAHKAYEKALERQITRLEDGFPKWVQMPPPAGVQFVARGYLPVPEGPEYVFVKSEAELQALRTRRGLV